MSLARQHYERVCAALANQNSEHGAEMQGSDYELICSKLIQDQQRLKAIQSVQGKIEVKRQILPDYQAWVDAALAANKGAQDRVLTTVMVWHIDAGNYLQALAIAQHCLAHHLSLPDQYQRTLPTLLLDEIPGAYLSGQASNDDAMAVLNQVETLTQEYDAPDQARAKLYKALGYAVIGKVSSDFDPETLSLSQAEQALAYLNKAVGLFSNIGVKKDIERIERHIKNLST